MTIIFRGMHFICQNFIVATTMIHVLLRYVTKNFKIREIITITMIHILLRYVTNSCCTTNCYDYVLSFFIYMFPYFYEHCSIVHIGCLCLNFSHVSKSSLVFLCRNQDKAKSIDLTNSHNFNLLVNLFSNNALILSFLYIVDMSTKKWPQENVLAQVLHRSYICWIHIFPSKLKSVTILAYSLSKFSSM